MEIKWFGHASFKIIINGRIIYIDPYAGNYNTEEKADIILVTHEHFDHMDMNKIGILRKKETVIIAAPSAAKKIGNGARAIGYGEKINVGDIAIEGVPAYNLSKPFHPKGLVVGFVVQAEGKRIYHAGDTDFIPEMENLRNIDVALLPIGGTYTMDIDDAVKACLAINPKIAVPMHYNYLDGLERNADDFKREVERRCKTRVEILEGKTLKL